MEKKNENSGTFIKLIKETRRKELLRQKLSSPIEYKLPQLTDEVDHQIQLRLQRAFEPYGKCMRRVKPRPVWAPSWMLFGNEARQLTPKEEETKRDFKKLYCFGVSSVIKGLERDELRLVLIWKATQPPELKKAVLSLVIRTGCPAASISDVLHPVKASYESLSSLTAMGVRKSTTPNVFDDLVKYVKSEVPQVNIPEIPKIPTNTTDKVTAADIVLETSDYVSNKPEASEISSSDKISDNVENGTVLEGHEKASSSSTKESAKIKEPFTDWGMYDIDKTEKKGFDGQDFIKFSDGGCSHVVEITEDEHVDSEMSFGIAASLIVPSDRGIKADINADGKNSRKRGKKRKLESGNSNNTSGSGYKELSIKQMKSNPNKVKKKKKLKFN